MREGSNGKTQEQMQLLGLTTTCFQEREEGECEMAPREIDNINNELKELKADIKDHKEDLSTLIVQVTKIDISINALMESLKDHRCQCSDFRKDRKDFEFEVERKILVCPESKNIEELKETSAQIRGSLKFWGIILSLLCAIVTIATVLTTAVYKTTKAGQIQEQ